MSIDFAIAPLSSQAQLGFVALVVGLLFVLGITFRRSKTSMSRFAAIGALIPIIGAFGYLFLAFDSAKLTLTEENLVLDIPFYGFELPLREVVLIEARGVNVQDNPDIEVKRRMNGIGLPHFQYGWFSLQGGLKAFVVLTDRNKLVYIPTTRAYPLLLSLEEPESFIQYLKNKN